MTLPQATPRLCVPTSDPGFIEFPHWRANFDHLSAHRLYRSTKGINTAGNGKTWFGLHDVFDGHWTHVHGREVAAPLAVTASYD
jgi:hypothetical protein